MAQIEQQNFWWGRSQRERTKVVISLYLNFITQLEDTIV